MLELNWKKTDDHETAEEGCITFSDEMADEGDITLERAEAGKITLEVWRDEGDGYWRFHHFHEDGSTAAPDTAENYLYSTAEEAKAAAEENLRRIGDDNYDFAENYKAPD